MVTFEEYDRKGAFWNFYARRLIDLANANPGRPIHLVDALSGNGARSLALALHLAETSPVTMYLVDWQPGAHEDAKRLLEAQEIIPRNFQPVFLSIDIKKFHPPQGTIDGISFVGAMHFIPPKDLSAILSMFKQSLNRDGIVFGAVCSIFNHAAISYQNKTKLDEVINATSVINAQQPFHRPETLNGPMWFYTPEILKATLQLSGLICNQIKLVRNDYFSNGWGDDYPEDIYFAATREDRPLHEPGS